MWSGRQKAKAVKSTVASAKRLKAASHLTRRKWTGRFLLPFGTPRTVLEAVGHKRAFCLENAVEDALLTFAALLLAIGATLQIR